MATGKFLMVIAVAWLLLTAPAIAKAISDSLLELSSGCIVI